MVGDTLLLEAASGDRGPSSCFPFPRGPSEGPSPSAAAAEVGAASVAAEAAAAGASPAAGASAAMPALAAAPADSPELLLTESLLPPPGPAFVVVFGSRAGRLDPATSASAAPPAPPALSTAVGLAAPPPPSPPGHTQYFPK